MDMKTKDMLRKTLSTIDESKPYTLIPPSIQTDIREGVKKLEVWEWTERYLHVKFENEEDIHLPIFNPGVDK